MATKRFIIEVEEGETNCSKCPFANCCSKCTIDCNYVDLSTMKIKEYDDTNEGKALLYAVENTAERAKREVIEKTVEWMKNNLHNFATNVSYKSLFDKFKKAMYDESKIHTR